MDSLDETTKSISSNMGFFKHVFNFNDDSKADIMNIIQYSLISLVPVVILNKLMQKYVPEAEEEKGSVELLAEIVIQIVVMFIGLLLISRIVTYIPTYSGTKYPEFNITYIILAVLMITLSLQTKLGEKVTILVDRLLELWNGKPDEKKNAKGGSSGNVRVSQPISQGSAPPQNAMNQSLYGGGVSQGTSISQLPTIPSGGSYGEQPSPDYNNMYRNDNNPMIGAASPGMGGDMIMAANEAFGSGGFGTMF
jgi:hypothetical protein